MAVNNLKSVSVTAADDFIAGSATTYNEKITTGAALKCMLETIELSTAEIQDSTIRLFRVRSNWAVRRISMLCDAMTSGALDIGLYKIAADGGAVVDADAYASAVSLASAISTVPVNHAFEARGIEKMRYKIWEDAGLSADPNLYYDITATITTVPGAAGTLSVILLYADPN